MRKYVPESVGYRISEPPVDIKKLDEEMALLKAKRAGSVEERRGGVVRRRPGVLGTGEKVEVVSDGERELTVHEGGKKQTEEIVDVTEETPVVEEVGRVGGGIKSEEKEKNRRLQARIRELLKIPNPDSTRSGSAGQGGGRPGRAARKRM